MNILEFKEKYGVVLFDTKGRINGNLTRFKLYKEISDIVKDLTLGFPDSITIPDRILCIFANIKAWPECESCNGPVKLANVGEMKFTPFCCFKCSRKPGASTFIKVQETCLQKYGAKSNLVSKEALQKMRDTGGFGTQNKKTAEKIKATNLKKYGCENVFGNTVIKDNIKKTHIERFGGNFQTMRLGNSKLEMLNDKSYCLQLSKQFCLSTISDMIGVASGTIYKYFEAHNITKFNNQRSKQEVQVLEYLESLGIEGLITGDRERLGQKLEIDILSTTHNIGIELHGLYWHSEKAGCSPSYHANKKELADKAGIQLIQIFENEWALKTDLVKSRLKAIFGLNERKIGARKCSVRQLDTKTKKIFISQNHIQGDCPSAINYGLFLEEELVACMTFSKSRFDKSIDYELLRFCCTQGTSVVGGFKKLISHFRNNISKDATLVSYADSRWSNGNVYSTNGFSLVSNSKPSYYYFKGSSYIFENRIKYQKHKLSKALETFDENLTEWDNMRNNGYNRIWDCGTTKWILKN